MKTRNRKPTSARESPVLPTSLDALLSRAQVQAALGGITGRGLSKYIAGGEFPRPDTYLGKYPRWRTSTVNAWIAARCGKKE